jgi:hypothetical protein
MVEGRFVWDCLLAHCADETDAERMTIAKTLCQRIGEAPSFLYACDRILVNPSTSETAGR